MNSLLTIVGAEKVWLAISIGKRRGKKSLREHKEKGRRKGRLHENDWWAP